MLLLITAKDIHMKVWFFLAFGHPLFSNVYMQIFWYFERKQLLLVESVNIFQLMSSSIQTKHSMQCLSLNYDKSYEINVAGGRSNLQKKKSHLQMAIFLPFPLFHNIKNSFGLLTFAHPFSPSSPINKSGLFQMPLKFGYCPQDWCLYVW